MGELWPNTNKETDKCENLSLKNNIPQYKRLKKDKVIDAKPIAKTDHPNYILSIIFN
jgi:hypothetical protein